MKIYETSNGYIEENKHGDFFIYEKTARNFDGWYDISITHTFTFYANGYYRHEYLGRMYNDNKLTDYETRKQRAISYLK